MISFRAILLVSLLVIAGCGPDPNVCAPGGGCFCDQDSGADVAACQKLGTHFVPYCCTDNGGKAVECGQPKDCVLKPGNEQNMGTGANYCCPR